jgi:hypothetical protein
MLCLIFDPVWRFVFCDESHSCFVCAFYFRRRCVTFVLFPGLFRPVFVLLYPCLCDDFLSVVSTGCVPTLGETPHGVKNQAQHIKVPPKPDSEKAVENLIHHRNPGPNIKTSYEDQPLAK